MLAAEKRELEYSDAIQELLRSARLYERQKVMSEVMEHGEKMYRKIFDALQDVESKISLLKPKNLTAYSIWVQIRALRDSMYSTDFRKNILSKVDLSDTEPHKLPTRPTRGNKTN